jgi:hypothetical protein
MRLELPLLHQELRDDEVVSIRSSTVFEIDTSVYAEERWEQNFPKLAEKESLFQYVDRVKGDSTTDRVRLTAMLKAVYCFIESDAVPTYKDFAKLFSLSDSKYTEELINKLITAFKAITGSSSVKN